MKIFMALLLVVVVGISFAEQQNAVLFNLNIPKEQHDKEHKDRKELLDYAYEVAVTLLVYFSRIGDEDGVEDMLEVIFIIRDLAAQWGLRIEKPLTKPLVHS